MSRASITTPLYFKRLSRCSDSPLCSPRPASLRHRDLFGATFSALVVFALCLIVSGCGGGTRGTGDQLKSLVIGTVVDTAGAPLAGATVTQLETGDSTATDGDGVFALAVAVEDGAASLLIEREGFEGTVTLTGLGEGGQATPTEFIITVDLVTGIVTEVSIVGSGPKPTPTPGPNPRPTSTPNPNSTDREHSLSGTVIDQSGNPFPDVRLSVAGSGSTVSGRDGRFSLAVRTSSSRIRVSVRFGVNRGSFVVRGLPTSRDAQVVLTVRITSSSHPVGGGDTPDPVFTVGVSEIKIR